MPITTPNMIESRRFRVLIMESTLLMPGIVSSSSLINRTGKRHRLRPTDYTGHSCIYTRQHVPLTTELGTSLVSLAIGKLSMQGLVKSK